MISSIGFCSSSFPIKPDVEMTPGALCTTPTELRYPEKIPYCDRNVSPALKWEIIEMYSKKYSFTVDETNRENFKIDHYIPLCMGGSNEVQNLWPQHKSIYEISDSLEVQLCKKLAEGEISQQYAIKKIKEGKNNYLQIPALMREIGSIRRAIN